MVKVDIVHKNIIIKIDDEEMIVNLNNPYIIENKKLEEAKETKKL